MTEQQQYNDYVEQLQTLAPNMEQDFRQAMAGYMVLNKIPLSPKGIDNARFPVWLRGEQYHKEIVAMFSSFAS